MADRPWVLTSKSLPTKDGLYEVTISGSHGKRYVDMCQFFVNGKTNRWAKGVKVIAWRERDAPYR